MSTCRLALVKVCMLIGVFGCSDEGRLEWRNAGQREDASHTRDVRAELAPELRRSESSAAITMPDDKALITSQQIEVQGIVCNLSETAELFIFLEDDYSFYQQYPPARVNRRNDRFTHRNARATTPGVWRIHAVAATGAASQMLHSRANRREWGGIPTLPAGCVILDSVEIEKK